MYVLLLAVGPTLLTPAPSGSDTATCLPARLPALATCKVQQPVLLVPTTHQHPAFDNSISLASLTHPQRREALIHTTLWLHAPSQMPLENCLNCLAICPCASTALWDSCSQPQLGAVDGYCLSATLFKDTHESSSIKSIICSRPLQLQADDFKLRA